MTPADLRNDEIRARAHAICPSPAPWLWHCEAHDVHGTAQSHADANAQADAHLRSRSHLRINKTSVWIYDRRQPR